MNVPLPPGADDRCMSLFLEGIFKPLAQDFKPQMIIRNGGADPHHLDGLGSLNLSFQGLWQIGKTVAEAADSVNCGIVDLCCSGYNPSTVAQGWASLLFGAIGKENPIKDHEPHSKSPVSIFEETVRVIEALKEKLAHYWSISE